MEFPQPGNILGDLKDRLNIGQNRGGYQDQPYDDYYDDAYSDDYGPNGYDESRYGDSYSDINSGRTEAIRYPKLVTMEEASASASSLGVAAADRAREAKAHERSFAGAANPAYSAPAAEPAATASASTTYRQPHIYGGSTPDWAPKRESKDAATSQDASSTASGVTEALSASDAREPLGSEGLNGLFRPTTQAPANDPARRELKVVRPHAYKDVSDVAAFLKQGNAVVLDLRATDESLAKRLLDFSFGVAAALEAQVECPYEKVYALCKGQALSAIEKRSLYQQGIR